MYECEYVLCVRLGGSSGPDILAYFDGGSSVGFDGGERLLYDEDVFEG